MKQTLISAGVAVLVVVLGFVFFAPVKTVVERVVGSASSPSVLDGCMDVNGVTKCYKSSGLNQASTTICSFKSPSATSTLDIKSGVKITTGTTTAIALEIGKSTVYDATTTRISYVTLASGAQVTLNTFVASTTGVYGSLGQQHTADETDIVFAPSTYLNVKYGAALGDLNVLVGSCKAEFLVN